MNNHGGSLTVIVFIWYSCWATERSLTPWWFTALLITFGYALYRLIFDMISFKKEVAKKPDEEP